MPAIAPRRDNPCRSCGACCATYRITLPRCERDTHPGGLVPSGHTQDYTPTTACMRENPDHPGRCIALEGTIGLAVICAIYDCRPSACRDFAPLAALGRSDDACDAARRRFGLPPLDDL